MLTIVLFALICTLSSLILTPMLIKYTKKMNLTDAPDSRKMHVNPIPTLGGMAIFVSFAIGLIILQPASEFHISILCGSVMILILGVVDDIYNLSPKIKMLGQVLAASLVVFWGGLQVSFINLPFGGDFEFGILSPFITIFWIVGITNAINLIDGLDGLSAGVSSIALLTIAGMAIIMGDVYVTTVALILFFSILGFLPFNFFPAKIFMGDTGALFLGYMIGVLSLLGFKNVTFISFIIPILILGVPISDTLLAMVRRFVNNRPMSSADSSHLHHRLLKFGLSHRNTVLFIYGLSAMFSLAAILFSMTTVWGSLLIFTVALIAVLLLVESLEMISSDFKPLTNFIRGLRHRP